MIKPLTSYLKDGYSQMNKAVTWDNEQVDRLPVIITQQKLIQQEQQSERQKRCVAQLLQDENDDAKLINQQLFASFEQRYWVGDLFNAEKKLQYYEFLLNQEQNEGLGNEKKLKFLEEVKETNDEEKEQLPEEEMQKQRKIKSKRLIQQRQDDAEENITKQTEQAIKQQLKERQRKEQERIKAEREALKKREQEILFENWKEKYEKRQIELKENELKLRQKMQKEVENIDKEKESLDNKQMQIFKEIEEQQKMIANQKLQQFLLFKYTEDQNLEKDVEEFQNYYQNSNDPEFLKLTQKKNIKLPSIQEETNITIPEKKNYTFKITTMPEARQLSLIWEQIADYPISQSSNINFCECYLTFPYDNQPDNNGQLVIGSEYDLVHQLASYLKISLDEDGNEQWKSIMAAVQVWRSLPIVKFLELTKELEEDEVIVFGRGKVSKKILHKKKHNVQEVMVKFIVYEIWRRINSWGKLYKYFDNENKKAFLFIHFTDEKQKLDEFLSQNSNFSIEVMTSRFELWKWQLFSYPYLQPFQGLAQIVFKETVQRDLNQEKSDQLMKEFNRKKNINQISQQSYSEIKTLKKEFEEPLNDNSNNFLQNTLTVIQQQNAIMKQQKKSNINIAFQKYEILQDYFNFIQYTDIWGEYKPLLRAIKKMKFKTKVNDIINYINNLFASIYSKTFTVPVNSLKTELDVNLLLNNFASLNFESLAETTKTARDSLHRNLLNTQHLNNHSCQWNNYWHQQKQLPYNYTLVQSSAMLSTNFMKDYYMQPEDGKNFLHSLLHYHSQYNTFRQECQKILISREERLRLIYMKLNSLFQFKSLQNKQILQGFYPIRHFCTLQDHEIISVGLNETTNSLSFFSLKISFQREAFYTLLKKELGEHAVFQLIIQDFFSIFIKYLFPFALTAFILMIAYRKTNNLMLFAVEWTYLAIATTWCVVGCWILQKLSIHYKAMFGLINLSTISATKKRFAIQDMFINFYDDLRHNWSSFFLTIQHLHDQKDSCFNKFIFFTLILFIIKCLQTFGTNAMKHNFTDDKEYKIYFDGYQLFPDILDFLMTKLIITIWTYLINKIDVYSWIAQYTIYRTAFIFRLLCEFNSLYQIIFIYSYANYCIHDQCLDMLKQNYMDYLICIIVFEILRSIYEYFKIKSCENEQRYSMNQIKPMQEAQIEIKKNQNKQFPSDEPQIAQKTNLQYSVINQIKLNQSRKKQVYSSQVELNLYLDLEVFIFMLMSWTILAPIDTVVLLIVFYLKASIFQRKFLSLYYKPFFPSCPDHFGPYYFLHTFETQIGIYPVISTMGIIILIQGLSIPSIQDNNLFALIVYFILLVVLSIIIYIINTQIGFQYIGPKEDMNYGFMFQDTANQIEKTETLWKIIKQVARDGNANWLIQNSHRTGPV